MSQMPQPPQPAALSRCPSCAEPLESGDRFCGACGYDLSAVPPRPGDAPTLTLSGALASAPHPPEEIASVDWPHAPETSSSGTPAPVHLATDLQGTDSHGTALPPAVGAAVPPAVGSAAPPAVGAPVPPPIGSPAPPSTGVRFDRPPGGEPDDYPLQAPAPRPAAATPPAGTKVCVACRAGRVDTDGYCENCGHAQPRERDHMEDEVGPLAAVTDRGLRHHRNEDAYAISHTTLPDRAPALVAIVCDGVSSATRPDEASLAASRAAGDSLMAALPQGTHPQQAMHDAIIAASHAVNALADGPGGAREHAPHQNSPACTLVGCVVTPTLLVVGWVGDSRAYWVPLDRSAAPARLTEDDSWAAQMVAAGLMNEAEAYADERAHAITGWLGADAYELEPHTASFKPDRPGVVVVCTDGLWNYAEAAEELAEVLPPDAASRPLHAARVLVGHALDGGGHDNVTVAVVPFPAPSQGAGSA